jgi:hypothetical protein
MTIVSRNELAEVREKALREAAALFPDDLPVDFAFKEDRAWARNRILDLIPRGKVETTTDAEKVKVLRVALEALVDVVAAHIAGDYAVEMCAFAEAEDQGRVALFDTASQSEA